MCSLEINIESSHFDISYCQIVFCFVLILQNVTLTTRDFCDIHLMQCCKYPFVNVKATAASQTNMVAQGVIHVVRLPENQIQHRCAMKTILKVGEGSPPPLETPMELSHSMTAQWLCSFTGQFFRKARIIQNKMQKQDQVPIPLIFCN